MTRRDLEKRLDALEEDVDDEYPMVPLCNALSGGWTCADVEKHLYQHPETGDLYHCPAMETLNENEDGDEIHVIDGVEDGAL